MRSWWIQNGKMVDPVVCAQDRVREAPDAKIRAASVASRVRERGVHEITGQNEMVHATRVAFVVHWENAAYAARTFGAWCPVNSRTVH